MAVPTAEAQVEGTPWELTVEIEVPFRDVNGDGSNDYRPRFVTTVSRVSQDSSQGLLGNCASGTQAYATVGQGQPASELIARRTEGTILMRQGCVVRVAFPSMQPAVDVPITLTLTSPQSRKLSRTNTVARATYTDGRSTFQPDITLSGFTSAQAGEDIEIEFRVKTGSRPECRLHPDQDHEIWRVQSSGIATRVTRVNLIDIPAGETSHCSYNVIWPDVPGTLGPAGAAPTVRETSKSATGTYRVPSGSPFTPDVQFDVALTDYDNNNMHDYGGAIIPVTFSPASGSVGEGCTSANTEFRYVVQQALDPPAAGSQVPRTRVERASDSPSTLIDRPTGSQHRCTYDVGFFGGDRGPDFGVVGPRSIWRRLEQVDTPATDDTSVSAMSPAAHATYLNAQQSIEVIFQVSARAEGETFGVDVTPVEGSHEGCAGVQRGATVAATGVGEAKYHMRAWPRHHDSADDECVYEVIWANSEDDGTQFRRQGPLISTLSAAVFGKPIPLLLNIYSAATAFVSPTVGFQVPFIDLNGDGDHDYVGQAFDVPIRPVSATNCTDGVIARYTLDEDGEVTLAGTLAADGSGSVTPAAALTLIGWHQDSSSQCLYTVDYPTSAGRFKRLTADERDDRNLSHGDTQALGVYETRERTFTARFQLVGLGVPTGTPVTVEYELTDSSPEECADSRTTASYLGVTDLWTQRNGVWSGTLLVGERAFVTLTGLTDWLEGWRTEADRCSYEVTWPPDEDTGSSYPNVDRPQRGAQVEVDDQREDRFEITYRAWYQRPTTHFTPNVSVSVPFDATVGGTNRFEGETITVSYARTDGQRSECTSSVSDTFTIGPGGSASGGGEVTRTTPLPRLVDEPLVETPGAVSRRCEYRASAADRSAVAGGDAGNLGRIGSGRVNIVGNGVGGSGGAAEYSYESVFVVSVDIDLPPGTRQKLGEQGFESGDITFKNAQFPVVFSRTDASHEDCLPASRAVTFTVGDSSAQALMHEDSLVFVDRVPGAAAPCAYEVAFPPRVTSQGVTEAIDFVLNAVDTSDATVSRNSPSVTRAYTAERLPYFTPDFAVAMPDTKATDDITSLYAGARFQAQIAVVAGPIAKCTPAPNQDTLTFIIGDDGSATVSPDLVHQLKDDDEPCRYQATFPTPVSSTAGVSPAWTVQLSGAAAVTFDATTATPISRAYVVVPGTSGGAGGGTPGSGTQPGGGTNTGGGTNPGGNTGGTNVGTGGNTGGTTPPPATNTGSGSRRPTSSGGGGGGSRGGSSGGGGSAGGGSGSGSSGGGSSTAPWVVAATSRVPVSVSLAMPERDFPVGAAIEVMLNVPGTCGDDVTAFAGLPAEVGLVYALSARSGTTAAVLAAGALQLAGYAERAGSTRDCEVRITLISAPAGCRLDNASVDEAGRSYVQLDGGNDVTSYAATPTLVCG